MRSLSVTERERERKCKKEYSLYDKNFLEDFIAGIYCNMITSLNGLIGEFTPFYKYITFYGTIPFSC